MKDSIFTILYLFLPVLLLGILFNKINIGKTYLKLSLAFSASYLLTLSITHLLPQVFLNDKENAGWFILIGFFIQLFLEFFSTGIEHGHVHGNTHSHSKVKGVPASLLFGLFIHSFLEGIPVSNSIVLPEQEGFLDLKNSLIIGIVLHNIPVTVALLSLLQSYNYSNSKKLWVLLAFAAMAPLGSLVGDLLQFMNVQRIDLIIRIALGIVVGIFLHISTTIMFENSENHKYNYTKMISIVLGVLFAVFLS